MSTEKTIEIPGEMKRKRQLMDCIVLAGLIILSACQFRPPFGQRTVLPPQQETMDPLLDIGDGGFLSGEPCGPPCFLGITLGNSTRNQTLELLQPYGDLQNCATNDLAVGSSAGWIRCGTVLVSFDDSGFVGGITYAPIIPIDIGDVISRYGIPDTVLVTITKAGVSYNGEITVATMTLTFQNIKSIIVFSSQEGEVFNIEPESHLTQITYVGGSWESLCHDCVTWVGFGDYRGVIMEPYP